MTENAPAIPKARLVQYARECHGSGHKVEEIRASLIEKGLSVEAADEILDGLIVRLEQEQAARPTMVKAIRFRMVRNGLLWFIGGASITTLSYLGASHGGNGGVYVITTGAILYGLYLICAGIFTR